MDKSGGQLIRKGDIETLKADILSTRISSWKELHERYILLSRDYSENKCAHAFASLLDLYKTGGEIPDTRFWKDALSRTVEIQDMIERNTYESRLKDYTNKYRRITFDSKEEMKAVTGTINDNNFIDIIKKKLSY